MFKGQFCYRITRVFKVHRLGQSRTIILFYYLFNHENGSIKMVFFLDVLYLNFSDSFSHDMAANVNECNVR